jgi:hypothetical protein
MTLGVQLPCPHHYRCPPRVFVPPWHWRSDRTLLRDWWSDRASTATGPQCCWRSDHDPRRLDHPRNKGGRSNRHPRLSNRPTPHGSFIICLTDFSRASRGLHDFSCTPRDTQDSARATHVPASMTPSVPPPPTAAPTSQHYSRHPWDAWEPPTPPLQQ